MKLLDKLINFIFSLVMLIVSVVVLLVLFNFIDAEYVNSLINEYVWGNGNRLIVIVISVIVFLAGLKTTIFLSDFKKKRKIPIMVDSENGSVQIAGEMIESTARAVALTHEEVKDVNVKMVNKSKGVDVYMSLLVAQDTNIRNITKQIQDEVKEKINETTGVVVLNTDIKVKNIVEKNKKTNVNGNEPNVVRTEVEKKEEIISTESSSDIQETNEKDNDTDEKRE